MARKANLITKATSDPQLIVAEECDHDYLLTLRKDMNLDGNPLGIEFLCLDKNCEYPKMRPILPDEKVYHFRHFQKTQCLYKEKSADHDWIIEIIKRGLKDIDIIGEREVYLNHKGMSQARVADLLIEKLKLIFEIQMASQAIEGQDGIIQRTADYKAAGYKVVWLLFKPTKRVRDELSTLPLVKLNMPKRLTQSEIDMREKDSWEPQVSISFGGKPYDLEMYQFIIPVVNNAIIPWQDLTLNDLNLLGHDFTLGNYDTGKWIGTKRLKRLWSEKIAECEKINRIDIISKIEEEDKKRLNVLRQEDEEIAREKHKPFANEWKRQAGVLANKYFTITVHQQEEEYRRYLMSVYDFWLKEEEHRKQWLKERESEKNRELVATVEVDRRKRIMARLAAEDTARMDAVLKEDIEAEKKKYELTIQDKISILQDDYRNVLERQPGYSLTWEEYIYDMWRNAHYG